MSMVNVAEQWFDAMSYSIEKVVYYNLSGHKNVKRISLSVEAATLRLKLGPLASSSQLWSFHTVEMSPVTRTYRLPVQCAPVLRDPLGLCFSCCHAL